MHSTVKRFYICTMNIDNTKAQMRKGLLELLVLAVLRKEQEAYVNVILEKLKEKEIIVVEGTIYPLLTRLKNEGYIKHRWVESTEGPPRKYYQLTDEGSAMLDQLKQAWDDISKTVNTILNN